MRGTMATPAATATASPATLHGNPTTCHGNSHGTPMSTARGVSVRVRVRVRRKGSVPKFEYRSIQGWARCVLATVCRMSRVHACVMCDAVQQVFGNLQRGAGPAWVQLECVRATSSPSELVLFSCALLFHFFSVPFVRVSW